MSTSSRPACRLRGRSRARTAALALMVAGGLALAGCGASTPSSGGNGGNGGGTSVQAGGDGSQGEPASAPAGHIRINVHAKQKNVAVDTQVKVDGSNGRLEDVSLTSAKAGQVAGTLAADGSSWQANGLLEPGSSYVVKATLAGADGQSVTKTRRFTTQALTLAQQTYPSISPLGGQTVGVGMPVIVKFDVPVTDRASIERHLSVTSVPEQAGSWHWFSNTEVHWRPKHYWKAGSTVTVHADVNGVSAGNGIYGQTSREVTFHVGDRHIYKADLKTDQMKVFSNGKLLRTIPITGGQPGFITRSGVKVIIQKYAKHTMNSETIGIPQGDPNYYNMKDVQWAMRMTFSGEFLHAAPWSVASQGRVNVSHGCTGMSTADADWLYHLTRVGDVVEETGTNRPQEVTNGYGDWNLSYRDYRKGSALA
jgi:lipoprotein-anchoring transpeptidase ErfK/SrfK